jgi:hypothetical protein
MWITIRDSMSREETKYWMHCIWWTNKPILEETHRSLYHRWHIYNMEVLMFSQSCLICLIHNTYCIILFYFYLIMSILVNL